MEPNRRFVELLSTMAMMAGIEINEIMLELYDKSLSPFGYDRVNRALEGLFENCVGGRPAFPSIAQIKEKLGVAELNSQDVGIITSNRVIDGIRKYGSWNPKEAEAYIGPIGWKLVKILGGWNAVCEVKEDELPIKQAQWREIARTIMKNPEEAESPLIGTGNIPNKLVSDLVNSLPGVKS